MQDENDLIWLKARREEIKQEILQLENELSAAQAKDFQAPEYSCPIKANVLDFNWDKLSTFTQFDVILMDPPWQLASNQPSRGVAIGYQQLQDHLIQQLPVQKLSKSGLLFIWVINHKYRKAFQIIKSWGYEFVDDLTWVKRTVNRRIAKGHGYYLQHAKETCLVAKKGVLDPSVFRFGVGSDVLFEERKGQSQKPLLMYDLIESVAPNARYLEIFGRRNNLRNGWVTIGNEL